MTIVSNQYLLSLFSIHNGQCYYQWPVMAGYYLFNIHYWLLDTSGLSIVSSAGYCVANLSMASISGNVYVLYAMAKCVLL